MPIGRSAYESNSKKSATRNADTAKAEARRMCRRGALIALLWRFRMPLEAECLCVYPFMFLRLWLSFGLYTPIFAAFLYCSQFALYLVCVIRAPFLF